MNPWEDPDDAYLEVTIGELENLAGTLRHRVIVESEINHCADAADCRRWGERLIAAADECDKRNKESKDGSSGKTMDRASE